MCVSKLSSQLVANLPLSGLWWCFAAFLAIAFALAAAFAFPHWSPPVGFSCCQVFRSLIIVWLYNRLEPVFCSYARHLDGLIASMPDSFHPTLAAPTSSIEIWWYRCRVLYCSWFWWKMCFQKVCWQLGTLSTTCWWLVVHTVYRADARRGGISAANWSQRHREWQSSVLSWQVANAPSTCLSFLWLSGLYSLVANVLQHWGQLETAS